MRKLVVATVGLLLVVTAVLLVATVMMYQLAGMVVAIAVGTAFFASLYAGIVLALKGTITNNNRKEEQAK